LPRHPFISLVAAVAVAASAVPSGLADGDPASDYLITQPVFLPFDAQVSKARSNELLAVLAASNKAGFKVRAAVISSAYDLGSVPILFRKPVAYAHFLGQELFYWYKGEVLVVMPNGYGVYRNGPAPAADRTTVAALAPPGTTGNALVEAASRAVRALAAVRGIHLPNLTATGGTGSATSDRIEIAVGAAAAVALFVAFVLRRRRRAAR
jgi:MYXO-CTERM domain-containing protein